MASALLEDTSVQAVLDEYTPAEFAAFARRNPSTVKAWFSNPKHKAVVRRYPRGKGGQSESLAMTEPGVRALARDIGFTDEEIETQLVLPHRNRLKARAARPARLAPSVRKRGRPPAKPPVKKVMVAHRRRR